MRSAWSLNTPLNISNNLPVQVTNAWTPQQRCTVLILARFFENPWTDLAEVFNRIFQSYLEEQGFSSKGLSRGAIHSQWHTLTKKDDCGMKSFVCSHSSLADICSASSQVEDVVHAIYSAALELELHLTTRESHLLQTLERFEGTIENLFQQSPSKDAHDIQHEFAGHYEVLTNDTNQLPDHKHVPTILFRCYSEKSSGRNSTDAFEAARFVDANVGILNDPSGASIHHKMLDFTANHINVETSPSPLISTTSSLIWALKKAKQFKNRGHRILRIAVLDGTALSNFTPVYHAAPIVRLMRITKKAKYPRYQGDFEYLAFQCIPSKAILGDFQLKDLEALCKENQDADNLFRLNTLTDKYRLTAVRKSLDRHPLTQANGYAIGMLALLICPQAFLEAPWVQALVDCVIDNWCMIEELPWKGNVAFVRGLRMAVMREMWTGVAVVVTKAVPRKWEDENMELDWEKVKEEREASLPLSDATTVGWMDVEGDPDVQGQDADRMELWLSSPYD